MIKSLKNIIGDGKTYLTKKTAPNKEAVFSVFKEVAQEYFGKIGLEKLIPNYFSEGTVFIKAQNLSWSAELWENKEKIIQEVNKRLGEIFVREIKMK